jgi:hypothetical protein
VPLSEHEQRILAELEESLMRHDPRFAERVRTRTVDQHAGRKCRLAVLGFLAGLAVLVVFYSQSVVLGLVGVALMFGSAVVLEKNLRRLGKASWHDLTRARRSGEQQAGIEHAFDGTREWLRTHLFRRDR